MHRFIMLSSLAFLALTFGCVAAEPVDASGAWAIEETMGANTCGTSIGATRSFDIFVEQYDGDVVVYTPLGAFEGRIDGDTLHWSGSYAEDGGTTTIEDLTVYVEPYGGTLSGNSEWRWSSGGASCSGSTRIRGTRASSGSGGGGGGGGGDSCLETQCPSEVSACGAECAALLSCLNDCTSDACQSACVAASPDYAVTELGAVLSCYSERCSAPSSGGASPPPASSCIDTYCSSELGACSAACGALFDCLDACTSDACQSGCVAAAPDTAVRELGAIFSCFDANC